jgi:2-polyprenyl-6-methoxyphenol hydroxylase-like FAD-dependent oxidoreductase
MQVITIRDQGIGILHINHLEEQLEKRTRELGVKKIIGTFQNFKSKRLAIITEPNKKEIALPYDIIVGADGTHSHMRETLGIAIHDMGTALGAGAGIIMDANATEIDISPTLKYEDGFVRRFKIPGACIVFTQSPQEGSKTFMQKALEAQGWDAEARALDDIEKPFFFENVPIYLQQAHAFSSEKKAAILVGDAAASASFFHGRGANTAFKTAWIAGQFFKDIQKKNKTAFSDFNQAMKEATDELIEFSASLFRSDPETIPQSGTKLEFRLRQSPAVQR